MVMRDVELHAAGNPRAEHADQRRLDHVLTVEKVVLVVQVSGAENAPAQFGNDGELDVLILEKHGSVIALLADIAQIVPDWIGVGSRLRALISAALEEARIWVR